MGTATRCTPPARKAASSVGTRSSVAPTLEAAFAAGGVHLVAVPVDYSENKRVLVDELKARLPAVEPA